MKKAHMVALTSGTGKSGKPWYRAILKARTENGPVIQDFWLSEEVGRSAMKAGLLEDCEVLVACELDKYLRPAISDIRSADEEEDLL